MRKFAVLIVLMLLVNSGRSYAQDWEDWGGEPEIKPAPQVTQHEIAAVTTSQLIDKLPEKIKIEGIVLSHDPRYKSAAIINNRIVWSEKVYVVNPADGMILEGIESDAYLDRKPCVTFTIEVDKHGVHFTVQEWNGIMVIDPAVMSFEWRKTR